MPATTLTIMNDVGLHARPAARFAKAAAAFTADVRLRRDGQEANAKSLLSVLTLGIASGDSFELVAEGEDADQALTALAQLVEDL